MATQSDARLLLVEDDQELALMVAEFLSSHGFDASIEGDGKRASQRILEENFDVVVLDVGLPGKDGISVCREVRSQFSGPIVVLTARGDEIVEVAALEVGADDYLSKPVRPRALLSRLRIHMRRTDPTVKADSSTPVAVDDMVIDPASRTLLLDHRAINLTTAEFDLLLFLAERSGRIVSRDEIYRALLEVPYDGLDRSIDLRVSRLRRKIGDDPNHPYRIKSVRGVGYILAKQL